jgi:hypothetical protein
MKRFQKLRISLQKHFRPDGSGSVLFDFMKRWNCIFLENVSRKSIIKVPKAYLLHSVNEN